MFNLFDQIGAIGKLVENLQKGDPVAIAVVGVVGLLAAFVIGVYLYDRKQRANQGKPKMKQGASRRTG
jgi:hypothetical protein